MQISCNNSPKNSKKVVNVVIADCTEHNVVRKQDARKLAEWVATKLGFLSADFRRFALAFC
jgi:mannitol-1-phosphate/altronate dehydrogenase